MFGREFDVDRNELSEQIASRAITVGEPDGSAPLIERVDLGVAPDDNLTRTMAADSVLLEPFDWGSMVTRNYGSTVLSSRRVGSYWAFCL